MKILVLMFSLICISDTLLSQSSNTKQLETLLIELTKSPVDTTQLNRLAELTSLETWNNPDSGYVHAVTGLLLSRKIGYLRGEAGCLNIIGTSFYLRSDYYNSLDYALKALQLAEQINDYVIIMSCHFNLMSTFRDEQDYIEALKYGFRAKTKAEKMHDSLKLSTVFMIMGSVYSRMNQIDSAKYYLDQSYKYNRKTNYDNAYNALELGHIYFKLNQYDMALKYYKESEINPTPKDLVDTYMGLANVFKITNQADSCLVYAQKAINLGKESKYNKGVIDAGNFLAALYQSSNIQEAYKFHLLASAAKDSIYNIGKVRQSQNLKYSEQIRLQEIEQAKVDYQNKIKWYVLLALMAGLGVIAILLYRNNQHKQKANTLLHEQKEKVESTLSQLKSTQTQLIQSEKLASLGELTAGIAHEIQNPLNFVNNFSELSVDLAKDLNDEIHKPNIDKGYIEELLTDLTSNQEKINHHGKRASSIVKGMLEHSRASTGVKEMTDINKLADEYLRLSYHGFRAKNNDFNADYELIADENLPKIEVIPQDIGRVLLNLINNAFYAVNEKAKQNTEGVSYQPSVIVSTKQLDNLTKESYGQIIIKVKDNGIGMPESVKAKVFQPFFTTKPTGQGTGLGLSLAYDIVTKGHGGTLEVESTEGSGTTFMVKLSTQLSFVKDY